MKMKKAQDGWVAKAACRRGVCGKGSVSDKRAARMDRQDARRLDKENRKEEKQYEKEQRREEKYWRRSNLKKGGVVKAQNGKGVSFITPRMKNKVTLDTTGYSAGKKRFPMKIEGTVPKSSPYEKRIGTRPGYGTMGRKSVTRAIEYSQGKPYKRMGSSPIGARKAKKTLSKSGSKISKKK